MANEGEEGFSAEIVGEKRLIFEYLVRAAAEFSSLTRQPSISIWQEVSSFEEVCQSVILCQVLGPGLICNLDPHLGRCRAKISPCETLQTPRFFRKLVR